MKILMVCAVALLALPFTADSAEMTLTLREAVRLSLDRNHLIRAAGHDQSAAGREIAVRRSQYFPRIFLTEDATGSNAPTRVFMMKLDEALFTENDFRIGNLNHPKDRFDFRTAFTIDQPLFDLNIGARVRMAEIDAESRGLALDRLREDTTLAVFATCVEVRTSRARLAAADKAVARAREYLRTAAAKYRQGIGLKSDELRARSHLAETEERLITAENDLLLARKRLTIQVSGEEGVLYDVAGELPALSVEHREDELARLAMQNRPEIREREKEMEKADLEIRQATLEYLPTLHASATWQMNDNDTPFGAGNDSWLAGISLRWELFDGMRRWNRRGKAKELESSAREQREQARKEILYRVDEARLRLGESVRRLGVSRSALAAAEEGTRLVARRYENSLSSMVELLDADSSLTRARAHLAENEGACHLAAARLCHATGTLLREVLKQ